MESSDRSFTVNDHSESGVGRPLLDGSTLKPSAKVSPEIGLTLWQPTLIGSRIRLDPTTRSDFEELLVAASDPLIWEQHPHFDRYQRKVFEAFFEKALASQGALTIRDLKCNLVIGTSRFYDYDPAASEVVIGYTFIVRAFWGGPINRELKDLMLAHAWKTVETALFYVDAINKRSQRAMEKCGARLHSTVETSEGSKDGQLRKILIYRIDKIRGQ